MNYPERTVVSASPDLRGAGRRAQPWAEFSQRMRMVSSAALAIVKHAQVSQAVWISGSAAPSMTTAA